MTREELNQEKQQEIYKEQLHERRKNITIFIFKLSFILIVGFLVFYLYTEFVSTRLISINEKRIIDKKIPENFNGLKVIQFSDLHFGTTVFYDELKKLVSQINERNADIVVFTGDLIDKNYSLSTKEQEKIIKQLRKINSTLGKYAVAGEEDGDTFLTIMKQSEFEVLDNDYDLIYKDTSSPILLIGLNSSLSGNIDINKGFLYFAEPSHNSNIYTITLSHEPDNINDVLNKYSTDLFLSGHSHNGSIRIPFIGGIYNVEGAKKYNQPYYKVMDTELFVSSGIGTNGPGFRLFCRPSFNFFRISNK